jgi:hypothetical protein
VSLGSCLDELCFDVAKSPSLSRIGVSTIPGAVQAIQDITGQIYPFNKANVDQAPDEFGVYMLYIPEVLIYLGRADEESGTLRDWLQTHFNGALGPCTKGATALRCEVTSEPAVREEELIYVYRRSHNGGLPLQCQRELTQSPRSAR